MTPPNYTRREVKATVRRLFTMMELVDNKGIHVRVIDMLEAVNWLRENYHEEYEILVVCGLFGVSFRDAEAMLNWDHVTLKERFDSGVAHLTDCLNGEE